MAPPPHSSATITASTPRFDPKALLNPKAALKQAKASKGLPPNPYSFSTALPPVSGAGTYAPSIGPHPVTTPLQVTPQEHGMGSMIEGLHNIGERDDHPAKRQKRSQASGDEDLVKYNQKGASDRLGGTGELGSYIREKRKDGLDEYGPAITNSASHIVDLTEENDDDDNDSDIMVMGDTHMVEVCLGRIDTARVNAHKVPTPSTGGALQGMKTHWAPMKVTLSRRAGSHAIIAVTDPMGHGEFVYLFVVLRS